MAKSSQIRLGELVAAMSFVADLGLGQSMEHVLRQTLIATRLGELAGIDPGEDATLYYVSLLAWIGCGSDSHQLAAWFGDDIAVRAGTYNVDMAGLPAMAYIARQAGEGQRGLERLWTKALVTATGGRVMTNSIAAHCVTTRTFAQRLGLGPDVQIPLVQVFERWDGKGGPEGLKADEIALPARIVHLADIVAAFHRSGGKAAATEVARQRRGTQFDPELVDRFFGSADDILEGAHEASTWEALLTQASLGPEMTQDELDGALGALADFTDLKSPYLVGHARGVAALVQQAAGAMGFNPDEIRRMYRAALVQDAGRMGVSNGIWDKQGPLSETELERVRLHPYFLERMLSKVEGLVSVGSLAAQHHERLDGSGYPRGLGGSSISRAARLLGAADVYRALIEERPHRAAFEPESAARELRAEARAGRLDGDAVEAVLVAAGHRSRALREWPAGLTAREVEVLGLIARGCSNREVARRLHVAEKTVGNHIEHIYMKIGSSTRAEASLFAMQHGLLDI